MEAKNLEGQESKSESEIFQDSREKARARDENYVATLGFGENWWSPRYLFFIEIFYFKLPGNSEPVGYPLLPFSSLSMDLVGDTSSSKQEAKYGISIPAGYFPLKNKPLHRLNILKLLQTNSKISLHFCVGKCHFKIKLLLKENIFPSSQSRKNQKRHREIRWFFLCVWGKYYYTLLIWILPTELHRLRFLLDTTDAMVFFRYWVWG